MASHVTNQEAKEDPLFKTYTFVRSTTVKFMSQKGAGGQRMEAHEVRDAKGEGGGDEEEDEDKEAVVLEPHRTQHYVSAGAGDRG